MNKIKKKNYQLRIDEKLLDKGLALFGKSSASDLFDYWLRELLDEKVCPACNQKLKGGK